MTDPDEGAKPVSEPRGWLVPSRRWFPLDGRLHKAWWNWSDAMFPMWPWRWLCWLNRGHVDDTYGTCVHCFAPADRGDRP